MNREPDNLSSYMFFIFYLTWVKCLPCGMPARSCLAMAGGRSLFHWGEAYFTGVRDTIFYLTLMRGSRKLKEVKLGDRLGVRRQVLALQTKVRILVPQPLWSHRLAV